MHTQNVKWIVMVLCSPSKGDILREHRNIPILNFTSHGHESLLHISGVLGTGLQEWDADLISKSLRKFIVLTAAQ